MPGHLQRILCTAEAVAAGGLDGHGRSPSRPNRPGRATTLAPPGQAHQSPAHPIPREPICQIIARLQRPQADVGGPAKPTRSMRAAGQQIGASGWCDFVGAGLTLPSPMPSGKERKRPHGAD
jgi:hypothetical protein